MKALTEKFCGLKAEIVFEIDFGGLKRVLNVENGFEGGLEAHLTKSKILDFCKLLNGVRTRKS